MLNSKKRRAKTSPSKNKTTMPKYSIVFENLKTKVKGVAVAENLILWATRNQNCQITSTMILEK